MRHRLLSPIRSRARLFKAAVAVLVSAILCVWAPDGARAQLGPSHWRPDERVLIADFSRIAAMTRGPDRIYAATSGGLVVYDDLIGGFDLPFTLEDGWPTAPVRALAYDDRDGTVWIGTADGRLRQLQPDTRRYQTEFGLGEEVVEIVPAETSGSDLFLRTRGGWVRFDTFLRRVSRADARRVQQAAERSPDLRARAELLRDPGFQAFAPFVGQSAGPRGGFVTDVVAGRGGGRFWVGTAGAFLVEYDHITRSWTPLAYGFLGRGVGALLVQDGQGIWFFPRESRDGRFGVARADLQLQRWTWWPADSVHGAPREPLSAALALEASVWTGGAGGLYRYSAEEGWREVDTGSLPDHEIVAFAATPEGDVWVGTSRGAALLSPAGDPLGREAAVGRTVRALAWHDGRLWIGTADGLLGWTDAGAEVPSLPAGPLHRAVGALAVAGGVLYAGLGDEVWRLEAPTGWSRVEAVGPLGAAVTALAVADDALWVGTDDGVVLWDSEAASLRRFTFGGGDLPSERGLRAVRALLPAGPDRAWVATPAGALRLDAR